MIRVGIVGCGFIGTVHSFALRGLTAAGLVDAAVTATYDVDPARATRLAEPHGALAVGDLDTLLERVDVVWVCTWTAAHAAVVEAAVGRGLAVFCEKPLATTFPECERVAAALGRVPHQVGLVLRDAPVLRAAAGAVHGGGHGRPMATVLRDDQYLPNQGMYGSDWRADVARAGGGTLLEHSIHDVDLLRWLLGDPESVTAHVSSRFGHSGIDDTAVVAFGYADGSSATLVSVWHQILSRGSSRRLEVFCERGLLWTDDDHLGPLHVETTAGTRTVDCEPPPWTDRLGLPSEHAAPLARYAAPAKTFLDAVAAGIPPAAAGAPDAATALAAHRLVDLAYRSAAGGGVPLRLGGSSAPPR